MFCIFWINPSFIRYVAHRYFLPACGLSTEYLKNKKQKKSSSDAAQHTSPQWVSQRLKPHHSRIVCSSWTPCSHAPHLPPRTWLPSSLQPLPCLAILSSAILSLPPHPCSEALPLLPRPRVPPPRGSPRRGQWTRNCVGPAT